MMTMTPEDITRLQYAKDLLENPGLAAKLTNIVGMPFEKAFGYLPEKWASTIQTITHKSLQHALEAAVKTLAREDRKSSSDKLHKFLVAASGGIGGAFGLPALAIELPATTVIMFRSIADIARSEGEDIQSIETRLACLEVFALGGKSESDNSSETGYYTARALLAREISEAAKYLAGKGLAEKGAPVLARFVTAVASRFSPIVAQKVAASAVPIVGAVGGAVINTIFMNHFQDMARGHFIIRRLERKYGETTVSDQYLLSIES